MPKWGYLILLPDRSIMSKRDDYLTEDEAREAAKLHPEKGKIITWMNCYHDKQPDKPKGQN